MFSDSWPVALLLYAGVAVVAFGLGTWEARRELRRRELRRRARRSAESSASSSPAIAAPPAGVYVGGPLDGQPVRCRDVVQPVFRDGSTYHVVRQGRDFSNAFSNVEAGRWTYPGVYRCDSSPASPAARWTWTPMRSQFAQFGAGPIGRGRRVFALALPLVGGAESVVWMLAALVVVWALLVFRRPSGLMAMRRGWCPTCGAECAGASFPPDGDLFGHCDACGHYTTLRRRRPRPRSRARSRASSSPARSSSTRPRPRGGAA